MTNENKQKNITLELEKADETLKEARLLAEDGFYRGAISRLYFYVFHLVQALLFTLGLEAKTHEGITHLFNLHFIRSGKISPHFGKLFSRLQKYREEADYDPAAVFTQEDVQEELLLAEEFAAKVREYLKTQNYI